MEKKWWHRSVVYQIYPKSFKDSDGDGIGDIRGITEKLDYLQNLGIDVIWLSPVYESPMDDNGYDISDYRAIAPQFGTMEDFEELVDEAKKRGIGIVMDLVVNHTSDEHPWFIESRASKDSDKRDYYIWKDAKEDGTPPNNWVSWFTRSTWEWDEETKQYYLHLFSKKQPDLNWKNPAVRREVYDIMNFWIDKGTVGFRMDVINAIGKPDDYPDAAFPDVVRGIEHFLNHSDVHMYLREMNREVLSKHDLLTVGETGFVTTADGRLYSHPDRKELNMIFQFEHTGIDCDDTMSPKKPLDLPKLKAIMSRWQDDLYENGWSSLYWSNHDQPRIVSRFGDDGKYRVESAKMLGTTLHFMYGTPYIYMGEELGLTNTYFDRIEDHNDLLDHHKFDVLTNLKGKSPEEAMQIIRPFSRDNARVPISWNESANAGFTSGKPWLPLNPNYRSIHAEAALADENSVFYHYKKLVSLRRDSEYSDLIVYGRHQLLLPKDREVYAYTRIYQTQKLLVVSNFTAKTLRRSFEGKALRILLSNYPDSSANIADLTLRPYESVACLLEG
ncbi:MAG: alpha-glucosidase [Peptostreptococcaceae bacterium]|nr:alpha-glucosidase [Peptostreptococcaceae bacterium]